MGCGGIQPRETDFVGRAWCGRGLRDRHPSTTRPTARSLPLGARVPGRQGGASTPSRSHSPRTSSARLVDRTATGATRPWRRQRATASRPLAGPRPARTLTNSPRDTSSCTSDGPLISCRDRAPAAFTVAREPTAASSQPKGCAPTPTTKAAARDAVYTNRRRIRGALGRALQRRRSERLERPNAQLYDTGGMRRTHLRGHANILKRLCIHVGGFNLGPFMRTLCDGRSARPAACRDT